MSQSATEKDESLTLSLQSGTKVKLQVQVAGWVTATVVVPPREGGWVQLVRDTEDGPFVFEVNVKKLEKENVTDNTLTMLPQRPMN